MLDIQRFWEAVLSQEADAIRDFFVPGAYVNWHNTNEHFDVEEFIRANCEYPGRWAGQIERQIIGEDLIVTAVHVYSRDGAVSHHVTSFIQVEGDLITAVDEYWGEDGPPPAWRQALGLGTAI